MRHVKPAASRRTTPSATCSRRGFAVRQRRSGNLRRGRVRYFGGDEALGERLANLLPGAGIGIADGRFASGVAARLSIKQSTKQSTPIPSTPIVVTGGESPRFCAPLPIGWLQALGEAQPELIDLFARLGLRRLGDLAALPVGDVLGRFGNPGVHAHRLAAGVDERPPSTTDPAPERRLDQVLDDPLAQAGAVVFVAKQLADELAQSLAAQGRVCTRLVVLFETEHGERSERSWYRSAGLSAAAMVDRVRWQLDAWINLPRGSDQEITGGIALVRLTPDEVVADVGRQLGLWGGQSEADRRAARAIARLSTLTSSAAVAVPVWSGGRLPADRYRWVAATTVDLDQPSRMVSHASTGSGPNGPWPGTSAGSIAGHGVCRSGAGRGARRARSCRGSERSGSGVGGSGQLVHHARRRDDRVAARSDTSCHRLGRSVADRGTLVGTESPSTPRPVPDPDG